MLLFIICYLIIILSKYKFNNKSSNLVIYNQILNTNNNIFNMGIKVRYINILTTNYVILYIIYNIYIYIYIYIYNSQGVANYWVEKKQSLYSSIEGIPG